MERENKKNKNEARTHTHTHTATLTAGLSAQVQVSTRIGPLFRHTMPMIPHLTNGWCEIPLYCDKTNV